MIKIEKLQFSYPEGGFCLDIEELMVGRGRRVAVIGPSGTGKTTLLNLISGVEIPSAGTVSHDQVVVSNLSDKQRRDFRSQHIGFVFQEFELLEYLNVLDNILLPYRISTALKLNGAVRQRAEYLADSLGMADKLPRYVNQLSQGERQRVAICRALLTEPSVLLADEPTGNLDPDNTERVLDIIFDYVSESGATLVSVTHDLDHVDRFDEVVDFAKFRKEAEGA